MGNWKGIIKALRKASLKAPGKASVNASVKASVNEAPIGDIKSRDMTLLCMNIGNLTNRTEQSADMFHTLQELSHCILPVIAENRGSIENLTGKHLLALFPEGSTSPLAVSSRLLEEWEKFNRQRSPEAPSGDYSPAPIGIGLHWGQVSIGMLKSSSGLISALTGLSISLAEHAARLAILFGTPILFSSNLLERLLPEEREHARKIATVRIKELGQLLTIYEYFGGYASSKRANIAQICQTYEKALDCFRAGDYHTSEHLFKSCLKQYPEDWPSKRMLAYVNRQNISRKVLELDKRNYLL